jgi:hypothetical protein
MAARRNPHGGKVISELDLLALLRASRDAVLVGGQAVAFWVAYFKLEIPSGPQTFISREADFLGIAADVERFSNAIGGRAVYPDKRDLGARIGAVLVATQSGDEIGVDVLRSVVGLNADAVRTRAIPIADPADRDFAFKVMHPIDCMVGRFEHLRILAEKQNEVGVWQARLSILICRAYIGALIVGADEREAIKSATKILEVAGTAPGLQAFHKYGLELLDAIPIDRYASQSFRTQQHARTVSRIHKLRGEYRSPPARQARQS